MVDPTHRDVVHPGEGRNFGAQALEHAMQLGLIKAAEARFPNNNITGLRLIVRSQSPYCTCHGLGFGFPFHGVLDPPLRSAILVCFIQFGESGGPAPERWGRNPIFR